MRAFLDDSIVCGKTQDLLPELPDQCVDAVITDPPYGVDAADWDSKVPYHLLSEFLRVSRGPVLWFGGRHVVEACKNFDPEPDRVLIWAPAMKLGRVMANGIAYRYHPIYTWRLPNKQPKWDAHLTMPVWDVLSTNTEAGAWWNHSCTKPLALMRMLCRLLPPEALILDPFAGSGTTCVAAKLNGQHFLGFEMNPDYVKIAEARLDPTAPSAMALMLAGVNKREAEQAEEFLENRKKHKFNDELF